MTRPQVLAAVSDPINDLRDLKGFDSAARRFTYCGKAYWWTLVVLYDESDRVIAADAHTTNEWSGLLDQRTWQAVE